VELYFGYENSLQFPCVVVFTLPIAPQEEYFASVALEKPGQKVEVFHLVDDHRLIMNCTPTDLNDPYGLDYSSPFQGPGFVRGANNDRCLVRGGTAKFWSPRFGKPLAADLHYIEVTLENTVSGLIYIGIVSEENVEKCGKVQEDLRLLFLGGGICLSDGTRCFRSPKFISVAFAFPGPWNGKRIGLLFDTRPFSYQNGSATLFYIDQEGNYDNFGVCLLGVCKSDRFAISMQEPGDSASWQGYLTILEMPTEVQAVANDMGYKGCVGIEMLLNQQPVNLNIVSPTCIKKRNANWSTVVSKVLELKNSEPLCIEIDCNFTSPGAVMLGFVDNDVSLELCAENHFGNIPGGFGVESNGVIHCGGDEAAEIRKEAYGTGATWQSSGSKRNAVFVIHHLGDGHWAAALMMRSEGDEKYRYGGIPFIGSGPIRSAVSMAGPGDEIKWRQVDFKKLIPNVDKSEELCELITKKVGDPHILCCNPAFFKWNSITIYAGLRSLLAFMMRQCILLSQCAMWDQKSDGVFNIMKESHERCLMRSACFQKYPNNFF